MISNRNAQVLFTAFVFVLLTAINVYITRLLLPGGLVVAASMFLLMLVPTGVLTFYAWIFTPQSMVMRILLPSSVGVVGVGFLLDVF